MDEHRSTDLVEGGRGTRRGAARRRRTHRRRRLGALTAAVVLVAAVIAVILLTTDEAGTNPAAGASPVAANTTTVTTAVSATTVSSEATSVPSTAASSLTSDPTDTTAQPVSASTTSSGADGELPAATVIRHGPTDRKWIALTFDDNYQGTKASNTIRVLKEYDVPATFFVIGHYLDLGPDLGREIAAAGFEVGDHTRSHANCTTLSKRGLRIEIGNGTDHYRSLTGAPTVPLFRPPGGFIDDKTTEVAAEKGFEYVVMWDIDTNDWRGRSAAQITETVMANAHNGAIVLMHMAAKHTAEALPAIITRLREAGYELVALTTMLSL